MAITAQQAETVSKPYFSDVFTENVYRKSATLRLLKAEKRMITGGIEARWPINYRDLGTADAFDPEDQVPFDSRETMTYVESKWRYYKATSNIYLREMNENQGEAAIIKLVRRKADEIQDDLATRMGNDLFTTNPNGLGITTIPTLVGTAAYGGVNEAVYKGKQATGAMKIYGTGDADLSKRLDDSLFGVHKTTHVLLSPTLHTQVEEVWVEQGARFQLTSSQKLIDLGLETFRFKGTDFVVDQFMDRTTALQQTMFGIDMPALICYESPTGSKGKWMDATILGFPEGLVRIAVWVGQLHALRRRTMWRVTGISAVTFNS